MPDNTDTKTINDTTSPQSKSYEIFLVGPAPQPAPVIQVAGGCPG